ncbi:rhodanese-like domain-containing protein [Rhodoferax aquaticus]|uniref:Sulfurtransferase n=1 Tax=Rhodoferax aquaticus TaxID=2527691 RepID=A0A515EML5_9BURK|nr:rhodanese-like domain-containing protein [Rhodoferax aquaticus]QDL53884.1 sulfurtransferase [Rhodoferax aquaticus]
MIAQVRPHAIASWLLSARAQGEPYVLDVREPHELAVASVKADGFALITIPMGSIPARLSELDPTRPVACLCHHGMRSMQVASFLERNGFDVVVNIAGGIDAWSAEVDPSIARY